MTALCGGNVRVGLEDNIRMPDGEPATPGETGAIVGTVKR